MVSDHQPSQNPIPAASSLPRSASNVKQSKLHLLGNQQTRGGMPEDSACSAEELSIRLPFHENSSIKAAAPPAARAGAPLAVRLAASCLFGTRSCRNLHMEGLSRLSCSCLQIKSLGARSKSWTFGPGLCLLWTKEMCEFLHFPLNKWKKKNI